VRAESNLKGGVRMRHSPASSRLEACRLRQGGCL
jgi:hypothetical protein